MDVVSLSTNIFKIATENKDTAASELKVKQNVVSKHTKGADRK